MRQDAPEAPSKRILPRANIWTQNQEHDVESLSRWWDKQMERPGCLLALVAVGACWFLGWLLVWLLAIKIFSSDVNP